MCFNLLTEMLLRDFCIKIKALILGKQNCLLSLSIYRLLKPMGSSWTFNSQGHWRGFYIFINVLLVGIIEIIFFLKKEKNYSTFSTFSTFSYHKKAFINNVLMIYK